MLNIFPILLIFEATFSPWQRAVVSKTFKKRYDIEYNLPCCLYWYPSIFKKNYPPENANRYQHLWQWVGCKDTCYGSREKHTVSQILVYSTQMLLLFRCASIAANQILAVYYSSPFNKSCHSFECIYQICIASWVSVRHSMPAYCQAIAVFHAYAPGSDFTICDPRYVIKVSCLLYHQIILIRERSIFIEVANVVSSGIAFSGSAGCYTRSIPNVSIIPSCVKGSRCTSFGVKHKSYIQRIPGLERGVGL